MNWTDYENEVFEECVRIYGEEHVFKNVKLKGKYTCRKRQIDVLVKYPIDNEITVSIMVDAKYYNKKIDVKHVESIIGMMHDLDINKAIMVTNVGYTKGAINRVHYSPDNFEVDILRADELSEEEQVYGFPYYGRDAFLFKTPFGWKCDWDGQESKFYLYPRGLEFLEAANAKEFMYMVYSRKTEEVATLKDLLDLQNEYLCEEKPGGEIRIENLDDIVLRFFKHPIYPTEEVTAYREFDDFFVFIVLFSPDNIQRRNIEKMNYTLHSILPVKIRIEEE